MAHLPHLSHMFPANINAISGVSHVLLFKGLGPFVGKEILLTGEVHEGNNTLSQTACIKIDDLADYVAQKLNPAVLDFYLESSYDPISHNFIDKNLETTDSQSRLAILYKKYKAMFGSVATNLRVHPVDVRFIGKHTALQAQVYRSLSNFVHELYDDIYNIVRNGIPRLTDPETSSKKINKIEKFMSQTRKKLEKSCDILWNNLTLLYDLVKTGKKLFEILTITEQRDSTAQTYGEAVAKKFDKQVAKGFKKNSDHALLFLKKLAEVFKTCDKIKDNTKYFVEFGKLLRFHKQKIALENIMIMYMDAYTIFSMLKNFGEHSNAIFFGGFTHVLHIANMLSSSGYFELIKTSPV